VCPHRQVRVDIDAEITPWLAMMDGVHQCAKFVSHAACGNVVLADGVGPVDMTRCGHMARFELGTG